MKNNKEQTPKLCKRELWFLYTALLLIEIFLPMKFQVDTSDSFCVMFRTNLKHEINKGNYSLIMQKRVMVLEHCTSPHRVLSTNEVSS